jgi:hypothetical protein
MSLGKKMMAKTVIKLALAKNILTHDSEKICPKKLD